MSQKQTSLGPEVAKYQRYALIAGVVGLVLTAIGAFINADFFYESYLVAFLFWIAFPLGSLAIVCVYHLAGGVWGLPMRRPLEASMTTIPLFALLFIPILIGMTSLYPWTHETDAILQAKSPYLNTTFWIIRAVIYFVVWSVGAFWLYSTSKQQDLSTDPIYRQKLGRRSRLVLASYVFLLAFASIDWAMSLDPHWFSAIFGMLFVAGHGLTGIAFSVVVLNWLSKRSPTSEYTRIGTFNDFGNLMLGFVMIWTYMNLSQYLIIWAANLPEEVIWFEDRVVGGWQEYTFGLFIVQFVLPFFMLIVRNNKRTPQRLVGIALFILVVRLLDMYWIVMPTARGAVQISWTDFTAVIGIGGLWIAAFLWRLQKLPLIPQNDHRVNSPVLHDHHGHGEHSHAGEAHA